MRRIVVIAACGLSLGACSSMPSWMQFDLPKGAPAATTMQFESEPAGAEARTSLGQSCRTPCSLAVDSTEFTVSFAMPGYQPQTVPVRVVAPTDSRDAGSEGESAPPRLVPNPVFVELTQAGAPRRPAPVAAAKPKPKPRPVAVVRPAPTAMAPSPPPPEAAPASPWPPAPSR
jgi:hypothetical protein